MKVVNLVLIINGVDCLILHTIDLIILTMQNYEKKRSKRVTINIFLLILIGQDELWDKTKPRPIASRGFIAVCSADKKRIRTILLSDRFIKGYCLFKNSRISLMRPNAIHT